MSKKHFIALAARLRYMAAFANKRSEPHHMAGYGGSEVIPFDFVVNELADFCAAENNNFNRERWLSYIAGKCGPNGGKIAA